MEIVQWRERIKMFLLPSSSANDEGRNFLSPFHTRIDATQRFIRVMRRGVILFLSSSSFRNDEEERKEEGLFSVLRHSQPVKIIFLFIAEKKNDFYVARSNIDSAAFSFLLPRRNRESTFQRYD